MFKDFFAEQLPHRVFAPFILMAVGDTFINPAFNLNRVVPHRKRANPSTTLAVKGFVNDHIFKCFAKPITSYWLPL